MSVVTLTGAAGTVELRHPAAPRFIESREVGAYRAPYGTRWHRVGDGRAHPQLLDVRGSLDASAFHLADDALLALDEVLATISSVTLGDYVVPVLAAGGVRIAVPLLTGWRVSCQLVIDPDADWAQA